MSTMRLLPISILVIGSVIYTSAHAETAVPAVAAPAAAAPVVAVPAVTAPAVAAPAVAAPAVAAPAVAAPAVAVPAVAVPAVAVPAVAVPAVAVPTKANLSGNWSSNLVGSVTLEQTGDKVSGTYHYEDEKGVTQDGKIEGSFKGKTVVAKWWERPKVGSGEEGRGDLEWQLTEDGKTLAGWYRSEGEKEKDDWNLSR